MSKTGGWRTYKPLTWDESIKILFKSDHAASLDSEGNRALAFLIQESLESLNRGLEELDSVQSEIAMLVEAAKETSSLAQRHISILSKVASSRETNLLSLLQQYSSLPAPKRSGDRSLLAEGLQLAEAEEPQVAPQPWPQGQG